MEAAFFVFKSLRADYRRSTERAWHPHAAWWRVASNVSRAALLDIFETVCRGISGKTRANRGPVAVSLASRLRLVERRLHACSDSNTKNAASIKRKSKLGFYSVLNLPSMGYAAPFTYRIHPSGVRRSPWRRVRCAATEKRRSRNRTRIRRKASKRPHRSPSNSAPRT